MDGIEKKKSDIIYEELGFKIKEQTIYNEIVMGLYENNGQIRYYTKDIPNPVINKLVNTLVKDDFKMKLGVEINKGKYIDVII